MGRQYTRALLNTLKDFCKETSATGFRYITDLKLTWFERCMWCILQLFLIIAALMMVLNTVKDILEDPLVISLETAGYPIGNIEFPGVALCDINKISKKRATEYAKFLSNRANLSFDYVFNAMKILGKLYDYKVDESDDFLTFQTYMEKYGVLNNASENMYLYYIMKNLSTPCEEMLRKCIWKRKNRNCSELFRFRRTDKGFCCTFNYMRNDSVDFDSTAKPLEKIEFLDTAGWDDGLVVVVCNEPDDYFYSLTSSVGINIKIFNPYDYPDEISGSLIEKIAGIGMETFLDLDAHTIYSVPDVQEYPLSIRKCIFPNEVITTFGLYSSSNCLVQCRMESILALCQCIPFQISWYSNVSRCTVQDIPCLNKYQGKWNTLYPTDFESDELEHEKHNSLHCPKCEATCSNVYYHGSATSAPLNLRQPGKQRYENYSIIRIYYGRSYTKLYKQDVRYYWFEILSNFGGLLGIFLGISVMSIVEFLYYISFYFISIIKKLKNVYLRTNYINSMSSKEITAIIDILCEFLEVAIHNILYVRKLYPDEIFEKRKKYGVVVYQSVHPQVNEYVSESLKAVRFHAKTNQLQRLLVCTTGPGSIVHERFVFDVLKIKSNFENDPIYLKLERNMRDFCLKLHTCNAYLQPLPEDASFRIMLHTTEYSSESFVEDPAFDNFPWIYVSDKECKISAPEVVPVHTIDTDSVVLQVFVETHAND